MLVLNSLQRCSNGLSSELHRLELTVMIHNAPAIALYQKFGFQIEGTKRASLKVDGTYVDEYVMSLLLD